MIRLVLFVLALLIAPVGTADADTVDYSGTTTTTASPLTRGGITASTNAGPTFSLETIFGLGVVGGGVSNAIDGSESVHFEFTAGPATGVTFNAFASVVSEPVRLTVVGFDAAGASLGPETFNWSGGGNNVSARFDNVPLSGFTLSVVAPNALIVHSVIFTTAPTDPEALIEDLADDVAELVDGGANLPANGQSLFAKLDAAAAALLLDDTDTAIGSLGAFINQVEAFVKKGRLTEDEGEALIEAAEEIIALLEAD